MFKRFDRKIIAVFAVISLLAVATFVIRLYELNRDSKAMLAEQAVFLQDNEKASLIETTTDNMFREVLKIPSVEGLNFMEFYAASIEDDTITLPEFKILNAKYKHFIASRDNMVAQRAESQELRKVKATINKPS